MDKTRHPESAREALIFTVAAASSLFFFHLVYGGFYPNKHGMMGADYTYFIPRLLDGYYWYHLNGPWQVPWFTPSFCGGLPFFGNPQSMYYSVPQALTVFFGPLKAVYYTVLLFALAGFIGFYLLLRGAFRVSRPLAYLGAALFMFNGFYAHRMIVGHFAFHAYQLLPLACYFLMRPLPERKKGPGLAARVLMDSMTAGSVFAYMLYSGMVVPGPPVVLSVTLVGFICVSARCVGTKLFFGRLALAGVHALILGAARIVAMGSFMESFTRSNYHFPGGTETLGKLAFFVVQILFFWPDRKLIINWPFISREGNRYIYDWHDYEYSVTIIPLIIIITSVYIFLRRAYKKGWPISWPLLAPAVMVVLIAAFPLALNYSFSSPWFEMAVKQTPVLSKYSKYIVWYAALIPMAIIIPLITLERLRLGERTTRAVAVVAVLLAAVQIWGQDRNHYQTYNGYDHRKIEAAGAALGNGAADPVVERIVDQSRSDWSRALNKTTPMGGDDYLAKNASQMLCYEPIFGYYLEGFPRGRLHTGLAMEEADGFLNLKNPACYSYPEENACRPGDHYRADQRDVAERFRKYKSIEFNMSSWQKVANWITLIGLGLTILFMALYLVKEVAFSSSASDQPPMDPRQTV